MASTMSHTRSPVGIFDLPLELRQTIYNEVYTGIRVFCINIEAFKATERSDAAEFIAAQRTVANICKTSEKLAGEIRDWERRNVYTKAAFRVTDTPWKPIQTLDLKCIQRVGIQFMRYDFSKHHGYQSQFDHEEGKMKFIDGAALKQEQELLIMRANLGKLVKLLPKLARVDIYFQLLRDRHAPDPCWWDIAQRKVLADMPTPTWRWGTGDDKELKPLKVPLGTGPIVQYLLEPLAELPRCRKAVIRPPRYEAGSIPDHRNEDGAYDVSYVENFISCLKDWIETDIRIGSFEHKWSEKQPLS